MTQNLKNRNIRINLLLGIISLISGFLLSPILISLIQNYGFRDMTPPIFVGMIIIISGAQFFIFRSLVLRKFDKLMWIMASIIYLSLMIAVLFLKGQGRGINLNLRNFFDQWNNGQYERAYLIGNCLAFVPYPLLLHFWGIKTKPWRAFLLFLVIEGLQFTLSVGAFDVYDLVPYIIGYLVGFVILILYRKIGVQSAYNISNFLNIPKHRIE